MFFEELIFLGQIGRTLNEQRYYATGDRRHTQTAIPRKSPYTQLVFVVPLRAMVIMKPASRLRYVPFYLSSTNVAIDPCSGLIAGTTRQDGEPAPFKPVILFHRPNMMQVRSTISDANGAFSFPCVAQSTKYLLLSLDSITETPDFNASVADFVTPVPMP